jgi:hypothetical protein
MVSMIRSIGTGGNASGYIDEAGAHFHLQDDDTIRVDLSKDFVFVSQPSNSDGAHLTPWQVFFFLQEPASKALFIGAEHALLVEKTEATFSICNILDQIWGQERFLVTKMEMVESPEARENGLARLMKTYEEEALGMSSEMWKFWDTFSSVLMQQSLGLTMQFVDYT